MVAHLRTPHWTNKLQEKVGPKITINSEVRVYSKQYVRAGVLVVPETTLCFKY